MSILIKVAIICLIHHDTTATAFQISTSNPSSIKADNSVTRTTRFSPQLSAAFNNNDYYSGASDFMDRKLEELQDLDIKNPVESADLGIKGNMPFDGGAAGSDSVLDSVSASERWSTLLDQFFNGPLDAMQSTYISFLALPLLTKAALVTIPFTALAATALYTLSFPDEDYRSGYEPFQRGELYDPLVARKYYSQSPILVVQRALQLFRYSNGLLIGFLLDKYVLKREEAMRPQRAQELLELIQLAGPTAIKVGQALSVRPDLIDPEYSSALATLQDRVPAFSSAEARALLKQELGETIFDQLQDVPLEEPVAAASIGQVYRGKLKNPEREVAIKVQRPNVLSEISLDLFIVREFAPYYQKITGSATNFQALAEEWGRGFLAELEYLEEARNTFQFNVEMKARNLDSVIIAPTVLFDYTTNRILTTEWVDGLRLDEASKRTNEIDDVPRLCSIALNAYLVMLLETGTLHCDPHPGNLLRTSDGKLCILDFGMTLQTDPSLQYSLLEFVAHLTAEEYDRVPQDLVQLGFLKEERLETVRASGFLEPLTFMLKQAGEGGGAEKVRDRIFSEYREKYPDVEDDKELGVLMRADMKTQIDAARKRESAVTGITMEVEELQKRNRDAFRIPEWFLYTSRAFLTLEGICLQADENYSIVQSCFPYVAKRLLADNSPRAQAALKELLYGASGNVDAQRLADLASGFGSYVTTNQQTNGDEKSSIEMEYESAIERPMRDGGALLRVQQEVKTKNVSKPSEQKMDTAVAMDLVKDGADILLNEKGNLIQSILVEEGAAAFTAVLKDELRQRLIDEPRRIRESIPLGLGNLLPPPLEEASIFFTKTQDEERAQELINKVSLLIVASTSNGGKEAAAPLNLSTAQLQERLSSFELEQAALVTKTIRENLPKYAPLLLGLGNKLSSTVLERISHDISHALESSESTSTSRSNVFAAPADRLVRVAARRVSSVAKESAKRIRPEGYKAENTKPL
jgi:predicted unusual protein kinase regulating ubiquinone biosynthesis (AarF/ABC1/UbiB family)